MKPIGFIYLTNNLVNGMIYVGKHEFNDKNKRYLGSGILLKRAIKKYGKENFKRIILRICKTIHELTIWEHVYIKKYHSQDKNIGYNIADGDVNTSGYNSMKIPEVAKKRGLKSIGKKHSKETLEKMSESGKKRMMVIENRTFLGKHHTEETKMKISKAQKGKVMSVETKRKLSEAAKKRLSNPENHWNYGKHWSDEHKKHESEIMKGRFSGNKNPMWGKKRSKNKKYVTKSF